MTQWIMPPEYISDPVRRAEYVALLVSLGIMEAPDEAKYSPTQPRDANGRWTAGAGIAVSAPPVAHVGGMLLGKVTADGGFTYQPASGDMPTSGCALSIHPEAERVFEADKLTADDLNQYLDDHADLWRDSRNYAGGWHDTESGKVYLDVSTVIQDRQEAVRLCKEFNQEGYFDLSTFETVITKDASERRKDAGGRPLLLVLFDRSSIPYALPWLSEAAPKARRQ